MVDLEPLREPDDVELVRDLLIQHAGYTGSTVAAQILSDWDWAVEKFVKVMPVDYRRVLEEQKKLQAAPTEVVEEAVVGEQGV
jgi:glutamate synthase domain-containing protein 3